MSGSGGSSGKVDYPPYIKEIQADWLAKTDMNYGGSPDTIEKSVTTVLNDALGASPFLGQTAYDPDADLTEIVDAVNAMASATPSTFFGAVFNTLVTQAVHYVDTHIIDQTTEDSRYNARVNAFTDILDDQLVSTVYPRFERGMQDIGAVMSSAFAIGRALIEEGRNKEVAKQAADMAWSAWLTRTQLVMHTMEGIAKAGTAEAEFKRAVAVVTTEAYRIRLVAKKEEVDVNIALDEKDAKWDLEVWQHGANVLAAHSGGTGVSSKSSPWMSALGGALSGAAMGAQMGGPPGAVIGGVIGGVGGFLSS